VHRSFDLADFCLVVLYVSYCPSQIFVGYVIFVFIITIARAVLQNFTFDLSLFLEIKVRTKNDEDSNFYGNKRLTTSKQRKKKAVDEYFY
jgi:hypothetical protein